jgi:hypothetical protein
LKLIGQQSVAGLMRWLLGLINVVVAIAVIGSGLGVLLSLLSPDFGAGFMDGIAGVRGPDDDRPLLATMVFIAGFVMTLSAWWVINRLRRIFRAVNEGDAFEPANVGRLRAMGLGLIGVQIGVAILASGGLLTETATWGWTFDAGAWLGILVVFMLAEVFRQGSAMRDEQRMTV